MLSIINILTLLLFVFTIRNCCEANLHVTDIISTTSGNVQGIINISVYGDRYSSFRGILYAETPERFQAPVPKLRVPYIIKAFKEGSNCMHLDEITRKLKGSEDCLYLNVYTPYIKFSNIQDLKPVVFGIHGGGFTFGSGDSCDFGPDGFINHNIVVVTINYRLGPLGWILTTDSRMPGDAGMKDQNLALKWVQMNIRQFGGDPKKVTLFGQSAGSTSTTAHTVSDKSAGLFRQIIALSGTLYNSRYFYSRYFAENLALKLGAKLNNNVPVINNEQLYQVLKNAPAEAIITEEFNLPLIVPSMKIGLDYNSPNGSVFFNKCYDKKILSGNYSIVPTLMGFVQTELLTFTRGWNNYVKMLSSYLNEDSNPSILKFMSQYLGKSINLSDLTIEESLDVVSQIVFQLGIDLYQRRICASRDSDKSPVYYYLFDFDSKNYSYHYQVYGINQFEGVGHHDELPLIWQMCSAKFVYPKNPNHPVNVKKRQMTALISNFVKYGNPTPFGNNDSLLNVTWPKSCNNGDYLLIQEKLKPQFKRPIGKIAAQMMPFAELESSIQSDCYTIF